MRTWRAAGLSPKETLDSPRMVRDPGQLGLDPPDALDGLDAVAAALLHAGRERQGQRVEDAGPRARGRSGRRRCRRWPGRPAASTRPCGPGPPRRCRCRRRPPRTPGPARGSVSSRVPSAVALLEVDRVEDRPAADPLEGGPDHRRLGGVDHERHARLGGEAAGHLVHVGHAVGAGVVDADVDDVRALAPPGRGPWPRRCPSRRPAWPRGTAWSRWRWCARRPPGTRCPGGRGRRCRWRPPRARGPGGGRRASAPAHALDHRRQVGGGGAAAAADGRHPELGDEAVEVVGQLLGGEVVVHACRRPPRAGRRWAGTRPGPRLCADRWRSGSPISAGPVAQLRPITSTSMASRALRAAAISVPGQHPAGQLDGHLDLEGHAAAGGGHGPPAPLMAALADSRSKTVSMRSRSTPPSSRPRGLLLVGVAQSRRRGSGRGWGTWSPGPCCRPPSGAGPGWRTRRPAAGPAAAGGQVELVGPVGQAVLGQHDREGAEGVGLDHVHARRRGTSGAARSTASGRVTTSTSLQPSSSGPPKSSGPSSWSCRLVPVAPSKMTTRSAQGRQVVRGVRVEPAGAGSAVRAWAIQGYRRRAGSIRGGADLHRKGRRRHHRPALRRAGAQGRRPASR